MEKANRDGSNFFPFFASKLEITLSSLKWQGWNERKLEKWKNRMTCDIV